MKFLVVIFLGVLTAISSCKSIQQAPFFVKGADVSWLPQMEASGYVFKNTQGQTVDVLDILKQHGMNSIRLRAWVNPSNDPINGHCSTEETVQMAVRAKNKGMKVMIDLHFSDSWADPAKQMKPKAWEGHSFRELQQDVLDYTISVMNALKQAQVTPEWVQVGNEIPTGMLYPEGHTNNWPQLAILLNKGYEGVKAIFPSTKVVLHVDQGNNNARFRHWFDAAKKHHVKYDIIGMSYYPYWLDGHPNFTLSIDDLDNNMRDMVKRYGKPVMVVEVGGEDEKIHDTYAMLKAVLERVRNIPKHQGLGVMYWEPEGARSWSKYALSAWGENHQPTAALRAFEEKE